MPHLLGFPKARILDLLNCSVTLRMSNSYIGFDLLSILCVAIARLEFEDGLRLGVQIVCTIAMSGELT